MPESLRIEIDVPGEIVEAIQHELGVKFVTKELKMWLGRFNWEEGAFAKRWNLKLNGYSNPQPATGTPTYPKAQLRNRLPEITGDDPGHPYEIQRPDRCVMGEVLPAGTLTVLRVNGNNERERWCTRHFNEALARQRGEET
jgi:hypothetical protein